jgi:hypothetical protein
VARTIVAGIIYRNLVRICHTLWGVAGFVPTGWPEAVHPPGAPGFEQTAVSWLLEVVPPDYRLHGVLVRHPIALAAMARHHLAACVEGARQGYRCARAELGKDLPPSGLAAVLAAYQAEGSRLVAEAKAAELLSRALRGETFVPQLGGAQDDSRHAGVDGRDRAERRASVADRAQTAGDRAQTAGDRAQTAGDRAQTAGDRRRSAGDRARRAGGPRATGPAASP